MVAELPALGPWLLWSSPVPQPPLSLGSCNSFPPLGPVTALALCPLSQGPHEIPFGLPVLSHLSPKCFRPLQSSSLWLNFFLTPSPTSNNPVHSFPSFNSQPTPPLGSLHRYTGLDSFFLLLHLDFFLPSTYHS